MILLLVYITFQSAYGASININEETNFYPCSFTNETLQCDGKYINDLIPQFTTPSKTKIKSLELLNVTITEIPTNYMTPIAADLMSIKIHSNGPIRLINSAAFDKCSKVIYLEIKTQSAKSETIVGLNDIFRDLTSLEELKLININIGELNLSYLQNLRSLSIENCVLTTISKETFVNNKYLSTLSIVGLKDSSGLVHLLENFPIEISGTISSLTLEDCSLTQFPKLKDNFFKNLTFLSLSRNSIENILPSDTENLKELQILIVSYCKPTRTTMTGLKMLTKLKKIDLTNIDTLVDLPEEIEQLESLEIIVIDMSHMSELSISLPSRVEKVSASYLKPNIKIYPKFLSRCEKLKFLNLNYLQTADLSFLINSVNVFRESLRTLFLEKSTLLTNEFWKVITLLTNLETLSLNYANIVSIPNEVLNNLSSLKKLSLRGNSLTYDSINTVGFQNISQHLLEIDLSQNKLVYLPPCLFYALPNLDNVNLLKTEINCDCNLLWLKEKIKDNPVGFPRLNFICHSGKNENKSFFELLESDLTICSTRLDPCLPLKAGIYNITFKLDYISEESKIRIDHINGSHLKFIFDHITVNIKDGNKSSQSDVVYQVNGTLIEINAAIQADNLTVCLILVRNMNDYNFDYNCQSIIIPKPVNQSFVMWISVSVGIILVMIILIAIICFLKRLSKKKREKEENYSNSSSKYSVPDETYQNTDQYTEIIYDKEYSVYPCQPFIDNTLSNKRRNPNLYLTNSLNRIASHSKSVDGGLNINHLSNNRFKFQKAITKSSRNLGKRQREFHSLHSINKDEGSMPEKYINSNRTSLPQQYLSRDLPILPGSIEMKKLSADMPPPKPKFPSTDIKSLLNNADSHLNYFRDYPINNSFSEDKFTNEPRNGYNDVEILKIRNHSRDPLSKDNFVII